MQKNVFEIIIEEYIHDFCMYLQRIDIQYITYTIIFTWYAWARQKQHC